MPFVGKLTQYVENTRFDPERGLFFDTKVFRYPVGGKEADAEYIHGQPVRVVAHYPDGVVSIETIYLGGICRAYPVALEKDHDIAHFFLLVPCPLYHIDTFFAYARNVMKSLHIGIYNVERCFAKLGHEPFRHNRPDALYHAGTQVAFNALGRCGKEGFIRCDPELLAVAGMDAPVALDLRISPGTTE